MRFRGARGIWARGFAIRAGIRISSGGSIAEMRRDSRESSTKHFALRVELGGSKAICCTTPFAPSPSTRPTSSAMRACPPNRCSRSEEHTSELQSRSDLVCRLLLEKKKQPHNRNVTRRYTLLSHYPFDHQCIPPDASNLD